MIKVLTTILSIAVVAGAALAFHFQGNSAQTPPKNRGSKMKFVLVETPKYSMEIPADWTMGDETPWGATDIIPKVGQGKLGAMTAGPTQASWDELFETSMYFIRREEPGTPTAIREGKTKLGYESASFEVINNKGFASRRYTLLRNGSGNVLALSIKIPSQAEEEAFIKIFRHMVDTAKLKS